MNPHPLIIVPAADRDRANAVAVQLTGNPEDAFTFDVPLCDENGVVAHYMAAPEFQDEALYQQVLALWHANFPDARIYPATLDNIGSVMEAALTELGLSRPVSNLP